MAASTIKLGGLSVLLFCNIPIAMRAPQYYDWFMTMRELGSFEAFEFNH